MLQTYDEARFWRIWREDAPYMSVDALGARIHEAWSALTAEHGDCGVPANVFVGHVRAALHARRPGPLNPADVDALCLEDLFLARGCVARSDRAIRIFLERYGADLRVLSQRSAPRPDIGDDVEAQLLATLFLPRRDDEPDSARLASYQGVGSLRGWLRVTARRLVIDLLRKRRHDDGDAKLEHLAAAGDGAAVQLEALEAVGRISPLVHAAIADLDSESRDILRAYYRDGAILQEVGAQHGRDTTWAYRRLSQIRGVLLKSIKRRAVMDHQLSLSDLREMVSGIADGMDLDALFSTALLWVLMNDAWLIL